MTDRDQTIESIVDALIGDFADEPRRAHQIAELGVEKDSIPARLIDRLTEMLGWNLVSDASEAGFVHYERVRRPDGDVWRNKSTGRSRVPDTFPRGAVLLVPRVAEEKLEAARKAARAAVRSMTRKAPKRASAAARKLSAQKAQATREAKRKAKAK